jgi:hypothetical protein
MQPSICSLTYWLNIINITYKASTYTDNNLFYSIRITFSRIANKASLETATQKDNPLKRTHWNSCLLSFAAVDLTCAGVVLSVRLNCPLTCLHTKLYLLVLKWNGM